MWDMFAPDIFIGIKQRWWIWVWLQGYSYLSDILVRMTGGKYSKMVRNGYNNLVLMCRWTLRGSLCWCWVTSRRCDHQSRFWDVWVDFWIHFTKTTCFLLLGRILLKELTKLIIIELWSFLVYWVDQMICSVWQIDVEEFWSSTLIFGYSGDLSPWKGVVRLWNRGKLNPRYFRSLFDRGECGSINLPFGLTFGISQST